MASDHWDRLAAGIVLGGLEGPQLSGAERRWIRAHRPRGVTLFRRNLEDAAQLARLRADWEVTTGHAPQFAIDQEGGRVSRLRGFGVPDWGPALRLGQVAPEELNRYGYSVGLFLRRWQIDWNFAPVLDLFYPSEQESIGDRCWSSSPQVVTRCGEALGRGMLAAGVLPCVKHFPGQGSGLTDTHQSGCHIERSWHELWTSDLVPFAAALRWSPMVMLSHARYPAVCCHEVFLSERWLGDILRRRLGFCGVIVSDDLTMGAVAASRMPLGELVTEALIAGVDLFLVCRHLETWNTTTSALAAAARRSPSAARRLTASYARVQALGAIASLGSAAGGRTSATFF